MFRSSLLFPIYEVWHFLKCKIAFWLWLYYEVTRAIHGLEIKIFYLIEILLFLIRKKIFCVSENSLRSRLFCPLVLKVNPLPSVNSWIFSNVSRCPFYIRLKSKMLPETLETLLIVFCTVFLKYKGVPFWCQPIHRTPTHIDR